MTTSDPRTGQHDDNPREHRGIGQRILDAVLGDPDDPNTRPADPDRPAERHVGGVTESGRDDRPQGEYSSYEQTMREHASGGATLEGLGWVQDPDTRAAGYDPADDARRDAGQAGFSDRADAVRDSGYDARDTSADARRDVGSAGYAGGARDDAGQAAYVDRDSAGTTGHADDTRRTGHADDADDVQVLPSAGAVPAGSAVRDDTGRRDADDRGYDRQAAGTTVGDRAGVGSDADLDLATSGHDPDRDRDRYDAQAGGTAVDDRTGDRGYASQTAGTAAVTDPADGPVARNTHNDADYDATRDTSYVDEPRGGRSGDYDPAQDTGYVDAGRADTDRTTGRRDDDYDTGRVDAAGSGDRVSTERVDPDRTETHHGGAAAAGAAGAGAVAAAAFGGSDRDRSDRDRSDRDRSDRDREFSAVDDTATVDGTDTGRSTADSGSVAGGTEAGVADEDGESGGRERLVPADRAQDYSSRWDALKGDFVDEPRRAVRQADELVGELLDELQRLFADQRHTLEQGFDREGASTEDLRLALRRYRSFFDRLLSF
jgi:hypothetical protein